MTMSDAAKFLLSHDNYIILTHRRPDGDTIGSAAALCLALRALGKTAGLYPNAQFTPRFAPYLEGLVRTDAACTDTDTVISVDTASAATFCMGAEALMERIALAIDHHQSHSLMAQHSLVQADKAACAEIVYNLICEMGIRPDKRMANALYVGISTDTGCFRYSNVNGDTLRTAAALLDCGADAAKINKVFFDTKSFARLQLEARLTNSVELYANGTVGLCTLPNAWLEELHITEDDIDSISGFVRAIEGVKLGILIREVEGGEGKISLRTEAPFHASDLCRELGGGGHAAAAGCSVKGGIEAAKTAILDVLRRSGLEL